LNFIRFYVRFKKESEELIFEKNIELIIKNRKNMGIEEAIIQEVKEKSKLESKILGIQKALKRNKLSLEEIAEDFEVNLDFVIQVKKGEVK
jgi:tRNA nucleotidyltransferase/poly(A) polymerase